MTLSQLRAKFPNASESFLRANFMNLALSLEKPASASPKTSGKGKRRDSYDSQLEADWAVVLAERYGTAWRHHGVTLRLQCGVDQHGKFKYDNYTPDFVSWGETSWVKPVPVPGYRGWHLTFWEIKGPHRAPVRRAGIERFKRFAEQTPWARFVLVERENGVWKEQISLFGNECEGMCEPC